MSLEGKKAPPFSLKDQSGKLHTLKDIKEEFVVLFFYPKDSTPGCTIEAKGFSSKNATFKKRDIKLFGISGGDEKSKAKFCEKSGLTTTMLSDTDFEVAKKFDTYGEKKFMGRKYMGIFRKTFVIDKTRKIVKEFDAVKPEGHAEEVLEFIEKYSK